METAANSGFFEPGFCDWPGGACFNDFNNTSKAELFQIGASVMHKPSGLGIYGMYQHESTGGRDFEFIGLSGADPVFFTRNTPDTDVWYIKPFWRKAWSPIGATLLVTGANGLRCLR